jgi:dihydropteroate synthase
MGIVNVTPDSFSDGGCFLDPGQAVAHGLQLASEGADILDIGGESTRPGAAPVSVEEELRRVLPVIRSLVAQDAPPLSIDTRHAEVAAAAIEAGACIVNDVQANRSDDALWRLIRDSGAGYVCMHMQGEPASMQLAPSYGNVTADLLRFFADRLEQLERLGVDPAQVAIDPGIGFGKTVEHNLQLLHDLGDFTRLSRPILLGISRKSFLGRVTGAATRDRIPAGLACTVWAAQRGTRIFRTHDVAPTVQSLQILNAIESSPSPKS